MRTLIKIRIFLKELQGALFAAFIVISLMNLVYKIFGTTKPLPAPASVPINTCTLTNADKCLNSTAIANEFDFCNSLVLPNPPVTEIGKLLDGSDSFEIFVREQ